MGSLKKSSFKKSFNYNANFYAGKQWEYIRTYELRMDESMNELIKQSIDHSINHSINKLSADIKRS